LQPSDAFWHLTNFFAPAVVLGAFAAALTKLIWRGGVAAGGLRLWAWASAAAALASIGGLFWFERDGRIATYAAMVVACAAALWWAGFRGSGKR
jgi:uncharacterized membrane protein YedE/YeeE